MTEKEEVQYIDNDFADLTSDNPNMQDVNLSDSALLKKDMFSYYSKVITPDMSDKPNINIPLFTKDMKVSNINDKEFIVFIHAIHHLNFMQFLKSKMINSSVNKVSSEDRLKLIMNFKLNLYSSKDGFERKIQHSKITTNRNTQTVRDNVQKSGFFGLNKKYGNEED